jgi:hypothetical protein
MVHRLIYVLALGAGALSSQQRPEVRHIDFRDFTFPFPPIASLGVPDRMKWMETKVKTSVTLVNGRCDFDTNDPSRGPSVILDEVRYGYLTMSGQLDAMAVLSYHAGGTAYWYYVYAFNLASGHPKLLGWFQTGSRADFGLYRVIVTNGEFILDLFDPEKREADCCSTGFVRTRYLWQDGKFTQAGPPEFGRVEESPKPR